MSRMLDLDKMEATWVNEIEKLKQTVQSCDKAIEEQQIKKQNASAEIEKYNRFILTAREMYGLNTSDLNGTPEISGPTPMPSNGSVEGLPLTPAVRNILRNNPQRKFTATEVTNLMLQKGFRSESPNVRAMVYNALMRIAKKGEVEVDKQGFEHYYRIKEKDASDSLLK